MRRLLLALVLSSSVALAGCGYFYPFADNRARASVEAMNLTDVHLTRTVMGLSCSKSDHIFYKFVARNLAGQRIKGVVCMSYFKGATVRITG
ncbi:MAG TPA: hypothetical protein VKQ70_10515 [Caulobacteraceae bacterium]|jgi:hypothetical protein|nr:hypothetical protein [Caulobacteraceae bacterium]